MVTRRPVARSTPKKRTRAQEGSRRFKPKTAKGNQNPEPKHQAFMATGPKNPFRIGHPMACEKAAIRYARQEKGAGGTVTIGVMKGNKCVFAEGPNAEHFLSEIMVELI